MYIYKVLHRYKKKRKQKKKLPRLKKNSNKLNQLFRRLIVHSVNSFLFPKKS